MTETNTDQAGVTVKLNPAVAAKPAEKPTDVTVTDSTGRLLKIREPSILEESRLVRALGDTAKNETYMFAYALPASMVISIDGDVVHSGTVVQLESAIQRLGRHGIAAVMAHITTAAQERGEGSLADAKK